MEAPPGPGQAVIADAHAVITAVHVCNVRRKMVVNITNDQKK